MALNSVLILRRGANDNWRRRPPLPPLNRFPALRTALDRVEVAK